MLIIVLFTCFLGIFNIYKALARVFSLQVDMSVVLIVVLILAGIITLWAGSRLLLNKKGS
jgi:hypothetical protein